MTNVLTYHSTELIVPVKGFTAQVHEKEYLMERNQPETEH